MYGSSTMLVYTTGQGVHGFTLDPTIGEFLLCHARIITPRVGKYYSVNESNFGRWDKGMQTAVRGLKGDMPDVMPAKNSRYIGSLVADFHRNLIAGGIFLYPADTKNPQGKLRLLYEASPMAFIAEQAEGSATDGVNRILDIMPDVAASAHAAGDRLAGRRGLRRRYLRRVAGAQPSGPVAQPPCAKTVYGPDDWAGIPARDLGSPGSFPSLAAPIPPCIPAGCGPCASTPASAPRRRPTGVSASCWTRPDGSVDRVRPADADGLRLRPSDGPGRSAGSAWRSIPSTTWPSSSAKSRSTRSPPR